MTGKYVTVEFYGVPRLRAGCAEVAVMPGKLTAILAEVAARCPKLADLQTSEGRLSPHYLLSLDGQVFVADLSSNLSAGSRLLLLSADAGG